MRNENFCRDRITAHTGKGERLKPITVDEGVGLGGANGWGWGLWDGY